MTCVSLLINGPAHGQRHVWTARNEPPTWMAMVPWGPTATGYRLAGYADLPVDPLPPDCEMYGIGPLVYDGEDGPEFVFVWQPG